jgi:L-lactate dehydrogenase complex protein LldG
VAIQHTTTSKEKILKKVRQGLIQKSKPKYANIDLESNVYVQPQDVSILETFARNFTRQQGQFIICDNTFDFIDKLLTLNERHTLKQIFCADTAWSQLLTDSGIRIQAANQDIAKAFTTITGCEALIARTGSVLISANKNGHQPTIVAPIHIVVALASQVVMEIRDAFTLLKNTYGRNLPGMLSIISGPSCTADIEKTIVYGAHGPTELFVFLINDIP